MADTAARKNETQDVVTLADVKALAKAAGPCITLALSIPNPAELKARLKSALRSVQKQLAEGTDHETAGALLAPIEQLAADVETAHVWANSLIAFQSAEVFRYYWMRQQLKDMAEVGERFQIRPLLAALAREQSFHLLAIGKHRVRLFRSTPHSTQEVQLEGMAPQNLEESQHPLQPAGSENEKDQDHFRHFLKQVETGVTKLLRQDGGPLILAGVEYDVAIYRQLNTYPRLLEQAIHGSTESHTARDLHERAWEIVSQSPSEPLQKALADYRQQSGAALLLGDADAIGKAAAEGRVAGLFLADNAGSQPGDPWNIAALETVLHGGWAFELNPADMPAKDSATALLRF